MMHVRIHCLHATGIDTETLTNTHTQIHKYVKSMGAYICALTLCAYLYTHVYSFMHVNIYTYTCMWHMLKIKTSLQAGFSHACYGRLL